MIKQKSALGPCILFFCVVVLVGCNQTAVEQAGDLSSTVAPPTKAIQPETAETSEPTPTAIPTTASTPLPTEEIAQRPTDRYGLSYDSHSWYLIETIDGFRFTDPSQTADTSSKYALDIRIRPASDTDRVSSGQSQDSSKHILFLGTPVSWVIDTNEGTGMTILYNNGEPIIVNDIAVTIILEGNRGYVDEIPQQIQEQVNDILESFEISELTQTSTMPSTDVVEIVFVMAAGNGDYESFEPIARAFMEAHPDIVVHVREPNYNNEDFSLAALTAEADCFQWDDTITNAQDLEILAPIDPLIDADPELSEEDFFHGAIEQFRVQEQLYGIPTGIEFNLLHYNKRLFDEANLAYPQAGWTVDEFFKTIMALTHGEDPATRVYGFIPYHDSPYINYLIITLMDRQGIKTFDFESDLPSVHFNSSELIAMMYLYTDLSLVHDAKLVQDFYEDADEFAKMQTEIQAMVKNDRVGIWGGVFMTHGGYLPNSVDEEPIGYVPYPIGIHGQSSFEGVTGYFIHRSSPHQQPCWEFIKYLTQASNLNQFGFPARISTAETAEIDAFFGAERAAVIRQELQYRAIPSSFSQFDEKNGWLGTTLQWFEQAHQEILFDGVSVEDALNEAQRKAEVYVSCMLAIDNFHEINYQENLELMYFCANEADPDLDQ